MNICAPAVVAVFQSIHFVMGKLSTNQKMQISFTFKFLITLSDNLIANSVKMKKNVMLMVRMKK